MADPFQYHTTFTLDKAYLTECYEQTMVQKTLLQAYKKSIAFCLLGLGLFSVPNVSAYWPSFLIALAVIEALSVRFGKAWWVTRQLLGKSGNNQINLVVDQQGLVLTSPFIEQNFTWQSIKQLEHTKLGLIVHLEQQRQYLSKQVLSAEAIAFIESNTKNTM
ncbi:YcxB family protein [Thalassotalea euphylliae]|nr:YcxB family protein [Thalassotalea euphylliae]